MSEALLDALEARSGIVCAVGAGGKKTTLYALAGAHGGRIGITTTVMMTTFSRRLDAERLITDETDIAAALANAAAEHRRIAFARPSAKSGRVAGIAGDAVAACHRAAAFDATYVKADGARMRSIKAPREDEPVIPAEADVVLPIVSAAAFGAPLDEDIAHRVDQLAAVTGLQAGETITPDAVARLLASERGALQGTPARATVIPVINAVDDAERLGQAEAAARGALQRSPRIRRIVLTSHGDADPLVETIEGA